MIQRIKDDVEEQLQKEQVAIIISDSTCTEWYALLIANYVDVKKALSPSIGQNNKHLHPPRQVNKR